MENRISGAGGRISGVECGISGAVSRISGIEFEISGARCRISGMEFGISGTVQCRIYDVKWSVNCRSVDCKSVNCRIWAWVLISPLLMPAVSSVLVMLAKMALTDERKPNGTIRWQICKCTHFPRKKTKLIWCLTACLLSFDCFFTCRFPTFHPVSASSGLLPSSVRLSPSSV